MVPTFSGLQVWWDLIVRAGCAVLFVEKGASPRRWTASHPLSIRSHPFPSLLATMRLLLILTALCLSCVSAFPSVGRVGAMDRARVQEAMTQARRIADILRADEALQKRQDVPVIVPDPTDKAHQFEGECSTWVGERRFLPRSLPAEPGPNDQRG